VPRIIERHCIKGAMLVVMSGMSMGGNVQGVAAGVAGGCAGGVTAPGVCCSVTSGGCAHVVVLWMCVSPVVAVPVLRCRVWELMWDRQSKHNFLGWGTLRGAC
jgi:hypothetical protein